MSEQKADLEAVLTHYGIDSPSRSGWVKIKCPIHDDGHASAGANFDEQLFHCFTCNVHGDVYTLIMKKEEVGFKDAVKLGEAYADGSMRTVHGSSDAGLLGIPRGKRNSRISGGFFQPWHM